MAQITKTPTSDKSVKLPQVGKRKSQRVLLNTPMKKYIVHHDPTQWDEDMMSAGETN
ncbi:hypothetical protein [Fibrella aquatilis]|uniref:Uncharacterized protein n=1 Tax=Fibrella aquatilis TaxID=2817059 RepID=A0A939G348_9BACT|nr:hypothetical protein [Fibrella aquatilis]MBO0930328.1 hypothetical protein [Fibrella aquatilis]